MKRIVCISLAILGLLAVGTLFTSCNHNDDPMADKVKYVAEGKVSGGLASSFVVANFQAAINNAVTLRGEGAGYVQADDAKVIAACDNYHNTIKDDKKLDGVVRIVKYPFSGGSGTVIKEYTYKKSN